MIYFEVSTKQVPREKKNYKHNFKKMDHKTFRGLLTSPDWKALLSFENDLDEACEEGIKIVLDSIEETVPKYTFRDDKKALWSTRLIKRLVAKKQRR